MLESDSPAQERKNMASGGILDASYSEKGGWHRADRAAGGK